MVLVRKRRCGQRETRFRTNFHLLGSYCRTRAAAGLLLDAVGLPERLSRTAQARFGANGVINPPVVPRVRAYLPTEFKAWISLDVRCEQGIWLRLAFLGA